MKGAKGDAGKSGPCNCKLQVRHSFNDQFTVIHMIQERNWFVYTLKK